ncbi:alpha/beta hydrolase family protein [Blastococcus sp. PRF04-17]|uniref:alpha/beta hydrolase family protein n=1 Tax=Blastococcus sp. PRF04-17 TaxID=2933797 RepID=UPI001FF6DF44|nr:alpha/beta fold hydrolase [Blastococcus sp. PRF04-17]UOY02041.1 alpha/beta hydrolase fold domain-containing protein [Blastococcus sp. PRF04-17]
MTVLPHRYGDHPDQFLELSLPVDPGPAPVAVVLHGGFWRAAYGVELARPLAADLAAFGYAAVAVEYRRVGAGGGWPHTLEDVAAAVDSLAGLPQVDRLDLRDVTVIGHSAGGHLAAWVAGRRRLPDGMPGAGPSVPVTAAVLQAGVLDLTAAVEQRLGDGAVVDFLGARPAESPERYAAADPVALLPSGVPVLCVHGAEDDVVPVDQSRRYAAAAAAVGEQVEVSVVPGDHMAVIDPASDAWRTARTWMTRRRTLGA